MEDSSSDEDELDVWLNDGDSEKENEEMSE